MYLMNTRSRLLIVLVFVLVGELCLLLFTGSGLADQRSDASNAWEVTPAEAQMLKKIERLMDSLKPEEAKAEWERVAPKLQHVELRWVFVYQLAQKYTDSVQQKLDTGRYRDATDEWERAAFSHPQVKETLPRHHGIQQSLPLAYVETDRASHAVELFKLFRYVPISDLPDERIVVGERLVLGDLLKGQPRRVMIGRAQCVLCHTASKGEWEQPCGHTRCGPAFKGVSVRTRALLASPQYRARRAWGVQQEAFPGNGIAETLVEYLAESNVCPSCYVVPGYLNFPDERGRESRMPRIYRPAILLSRDEMIAVDTWILAQDGEQIPALAVMRAAYDKFMPRDEDPGASPALFLAALYDAAGQSSEAVRLVEENYPTTAHGVSKLRFSLEEWRNDPHMFVNMKKQPDLREKYPLLLTPNHEYTKDPVFSRTRSTQEDKAGKE